MHGPRASTGWKHCGQFAVKYRSETYCWTKKLNREDYGVDKYWELLAIVKEYTLLKNNAHRCVHLTNDQFTPGQIYRVDYDGVIFIGEQEGILVHVCVSMVLFLIHSSVSQFSSDIHTNL